MATGGIWRGLVRGVPRNVLRKYKRRVNKKEMQEPFRKWRILRGDTVQILRGRDAGQQGVVKRVDRKRNKVEVTGLNLQRKHVKKTEQREGGTFSVEGAIHVSRINLVCPETKCVRATRAFGVLCAQQHREGRARSSTHAPRLALFRSPPCFGALLRLLAALLQAADARANGVPRGRKQSARCGALGRYH